MEHSTHWPCVCPTWAERARRQAGRWGWGAQPGLYQEQDALRLGPVHAQLHTPSEQLGGIPRLWCWPLRTSGELGGFLLRGAHLNPPLEQGGGDGKEKAQECLACSLRARRLQVALDRHFLDTHCVSVPCGKGFLTAQLNCRDTGRSVEALAALLWWEALQGAAPALLHGDVLHPRGTTVLKAELPGTSGLGQSGKASVPDPLCLFLEAPREGCWVESLWLAPRSLLVLLEPPGQNPFPHPFHSGGLGSPELAAFPPSSQLMTLTSASVPTSPSL